MKLCRRKLHLRPDNQTRCTECIKTWDRLRYPKRSEQLKSYTKLKYKKESEIIKNRVAKYRKNNPEKHLNCSLKWQKNNRDKANKNNAQYKLMKKEATPKWLTKDHLELIKMKHQLARYLTEVTGIKWVTDHIIPIRGKNVRGLHVPWNIRVISHSENCSKGERVG